MRRDIFEIIEEVRRNEMAFSIATNGTLVTPEAAARLKELNCAFVQVSLDGATAQTHDSFREAKSFGATLEGIRNLATTGIQFGIAATTTKHNISEISYLVDKAEKLGTSCSCPITSFQTAWEPPSTRKNQVEAARGTLEQVGRAD